MSKYMRKIYALATVLLMSMHIGLIAQVGIGTTTPNGALDIVSANDGLLIPRIALVNTVTATVITPTVSELVYNTVSINDVTPGYYYWDGSKWVQLQTGAKNEWSLTGNAGTVAGTNFLGTTDNIGLRFKTNNADRFEISNNGFLRSFADGTAAIPAYSWNSNNNMGVFRVNANTMGFSTASAERMRITPTGQVGIGTTAPNASAVLDVSSPNKGVSFPNINLTSETDAATIAAPVPGLMVYNTNSGMPCGKGLYFNNGTNVAPVWTCFTKTVRQYHAYDTAGRTNITSATATLQPGCTITLTVPTGQVADIKIDGVLGGTNVSTITSDYGVFDAIVYVDGTFLPKGGWNRTSIVNASNTNSFNVCTVSTTWTGVTSGVHTIQLFTRRSYGNSAVTLGGDCSLITNCGEIHAIVTYR